MNSADWQAMQNRRNYYRILQVQPGAPPELIRVSYRTLMQRLKMHPDLGGDHQQAVLINEAFATLSDPEKRADYDRQLEDSQRGRQASAAAARSSREAARSTQEAARSARETERATREAAARMANVCLFCGAAHPAHAASEPTAVCWRCQSPLFSAVQQPRESGAGREWDRMARQMPVEVRSAGRDPHVFTSKTEDLSITGARFASAVELLPGQRVKLDCAFCVAVGVVRHAHAEATGKTRQWQIGVEFVTLLIKRTRGSFVSTQA